MSTSLITTIAINLAILLLASWAIGLLIFVRLLKDKEELETALINIRKKLKKSRQKPKTPPPTAPTPEPIDPEYPLEPVVLDENAETESPLYLLDAFNDLSNGLQEKERQLALLANLQAKQKDMLEGWQDDETGKSEEAMANHEETQKVVEKLQHNLKINQRVIEHLEAKLREGQDKDGRIAILEETEKRLRDRVDRLKKNKEQATILAEGLKKANEKKQALIHDNDRLKRNIKELSNASQEQLATINKISIELERATNLERHQRQVISELEIKLHSEKSNENDDSVVAELEQQLQQTSETLERTLKEKEFIESHLLEMDQALNESKETEAALERAKKEIETLEMYFPEFEASAESNSNEENKDAHQPLPQLTVNAEDDPELFNAINDNRLFGVLQEFWMTLDTPPLQLLAEGNVSRPKKLEHWVKTSIHNDEYFIAIGTSERLTEILTKAMFEKNVAAMDDSDLKDALGELGNIIAGTLANELNPDFTLGISQHIDNNTIEEELAKVAVATEVLMSANEQPLYILLAKPVDSGAD